MTALSEAISIRPCRGFAELDACVDLQEQTWGYDQRDVIPRRLFVVAQRIGGQVFGAFHGQEGGEAQGDHPEMVGFAMALPALQRDGVYLHSHMLAVRPEFRNAGLGRALKLAQREEALSRGIRLMEWTFDPLEIKNAYLNLNRLGAIVRSYTPDFYGPMPSSLGLPTDRLHAEWYLDSERVRQRVKGGVGEPGEIRRTVLVPAEIAEWKRKDPGRGLALEAQSQVRNLLQRGFQEGLAVVGFTRDEAGNGIYQLAEDPGADLAGQV